MTWPRSSGESITAACCAISSPPSNKPETRSSLALPQRRITRGRRLDGIKPTRLRRCSSMIGAASQTSDEGGCSGISAGGRPAEMPEQPPSSEVWEAAPIMEEQRRNLVGLIPSNLRPRVILRWGNASELLVSGLLDGGDEIAQHAAVIDSPLERGHVILFSMNPFWRGQTAGS